MSDRKREFEKTEQAYADRALPLEWIDDPVRRSIAAQVVDEVLAVSLQELYAARVASGVSEADLRVALLSLGFEVERAVRS